MTITFGQAVIMALVLALFVIIGYFIGKNQGAGGNTPALNSQSFAPSASPAPAIASGVSGETVAVISAAIAAFMSGEAPGVAYKITGIAPSRSTIRTGARPAWGFAGMRQNTEPF